MKTLIIHPQDRSTDFLKPIYETIPDKTVITGGMSRDEVEKQIELHDRIIMMGHGCPDGLFSCGRFTNSYGFIIGHDTVELLREKPECIYIWCNADMFVKTHDLRGFYSGMFISEVGEGNYYGYNTNQKEVNQSNDTFSEILSEHINQDVSTIYEEVKSKYGNTLNQLSLFNSERLYLSQ